MATEGRLADRGGFDGQMLTYLRPRATRWAARHQSYMREVCPLRSGNLDGPQQVPKERSFRLCVAVNVRCQDFAGVGGVVRRIAYSRDPLKGMNSVPLSTSRSDSIS